MDQRTSGFSAHRTYLIAAVLAAAITSVGNVIAMNWQRIVPKGDPADQPAESAVVPGGRLTADYADEGGPAGDSSAFGQWEERKQDQPYRAESDGFVAAYTGGIDPADEFVVEVGELDIKSGVTSWAVRTRAGRYDGTVCPVSKGDYWRVRSFGRGAIYVTWLPVSASLSGA